MNQRISLLSILALVLFYSTGCSCFCGSCKTAARAAMTTEPTDDLAGLGLQDAFFEFDSSSLDAKAQGALTRSGEVLKANAARQVVVEGHCDERGTNEYNMALGERRAQSAYDHLRSIGAKPEQMKIISFGEERPFAQGSTEAAWSQNRRVHFSKP